MCFLSGKGMLFGGDTKLVQEVTHPLYQVQGSDFLLLTTLLIIWSVKCKNKYMVNCDFLLSPRAQSDFFKFLVLSNQHFLFTVYKWQRTEENAYV